MKFYVKPGVKRSILTIALLAGLAACGGGGDGGGGGGLNTRQSSDTVPASAVASNAAFVAYLNKLPTNETEEPLNASSVTPPTTDTDEPTEV